MKSWIKMHKMLSLILPCGGRVARSLKSEVSHGNAWVVCSNSDYPDAPLTLREFEVRRSVSADSGKSELLYEEGWGQSPCFMPTYDLDGIGNLQLSSFNSATNAYTANCLNQYTSIQEISAPSAPPREPTYDLDGNMLTDGALSFTYDAASRLKTVSSNNVLLVTNFYDAKSRRVKNRSGGQT